MKTVFEIIKCLVLIAVFFGVVWVINHPVETGHWYAKFQKGQLTEFYER